MNHKNHIDLLVNKATSYLNESQSLLGKLLQETTDTDDGGSSDEDTILKIQLTLQYRLSCQDALILLFRLDRDLLSYLGIEPQQSVKTNMDRLAYAVGYDDLKQILNVLGVLTSALSKIVARYKNNQASFALRDRKSEKHPVHINEFLTLSDNQSQFFEVVEALDLQIEALIKLPADEPTVDYLADLRERILQLQEVLINELEQAKALYLHENKSPLIDYQLNTLLKETAQVLHVMPSVYNPRPNFPMKQFDNPVTSEQLEERASIKRLRPFFGH